ncbi:hypothetical protein CDD82_5273 [Ophiocordyceps australis]|uniref:Uncharacterized protein n=1 Tax=Ophiocordyceps australis TaxID=1399860 RepID=A0A2C5Z274_9HYPO|nr:hypothetical protein CDD82_5273 [Ophiocordyceps australis]
MVALFYAVLLGAATLAHASPPFIKPNNSTSVEITHSSTSDKLHHTSTEKSHAVPTKIFHAPSYRCHGGTSTYTKTATQTTPRPTFSSSSPTPCANGKTKPSGSTFSSKKSWFGSSSSGSNKGPNRFGFKGQQTATFTSNGPIATLSPNVHWSYDTKPVKNVRPVPVGKGSEMYYGNGDAKQAGHFAFLTYYFDSPSVNLDHSDHIDVSDFDQDRLAVSFSSDEAFSHAADSWPTEEPLILISYIKGCGEWEKGERCYFSASKLHVDHSSKTIVASGESKHPDGIISRGETKWGWWVPHAESAAQESKDSSSTSPSFSWTAAPSPSTSSIVRRTATRLASAARATRESAAFDAARGHCATAPDTRYGLPSACLGPFFDQQLDDALGYVPLDAADRALIDHLAPTYGHEGELVGGSNTDFDDADPFWKHRRRAAALEGRGFWSWLWKEMKKPFVAAYTAVRDALTISASINKEFSWKIPNPAEPASDANKVVDKHAKQVSSPWGKDAIVIRSFGSQEADSHGVVSYLNVFCVQCGVEGSARIAGSASWTPLGGFTQGRVELHTDIIFKLQLGIDAQIRYRQSFSTNLVNVGLPGLSYGVVTIGPYISVGTRVALEAAAKGRMLAGAEMGIHDARVVVDFVDSANSERAGWEPYFKPVFEAEGQIALSATLGLPVGLKLGIQISTWEKSIGVIDEPSITATAQVAASIGWDDGALSEGFTSTNGCAGISTKLSWRNKLWIDILGFKEIPLLDTTERPIARGCIALPSRIQKASRYPNTTTRHSHAVRRDVLLPRLAAVQDTTAVFASRANAAPRLSYTPRSFENHAYTDTDGFSYSLLATPRHDGIVLSCSNGNMYVVRSASDDNPDCSELWATKHDDTLVFDGTQKVMHYYTQTMAQIGVSRLRLDPEYHAPNSSALVVWALNKHADAPEQSYYVAVAADRQFFYPLVCDYAEADLGAKVFLARDPQEGIRMLESPHLKYTVTGGTVTRCYNLVTMPDYLVGRREDVDRTYLRLGSTGLGP